MVLDAPLMKKITFLLLFISAMQDCFASPPTPPQKTFEPLPLSGIVFDCNLSQIQTIKQQGQIFLEESGVDSSAYLIDITSDRKLQFHLTSDDTSTLGLASKWHLNPATIELEGHLYETASKAEILLAMMSAGRTRTYSGSACSIHAWNDEVNLRQQAVAWASHLSWGWPNGGSAQWNENFWHKGTPLLGADGASDALLDTFIHQEQYGIGCYTATKIIYAHTYLNFYKHKSQTEYLHATKIVSPDGEPLVNIEPGYLWSFEDDFDPAESLRPGKILGALLGVSPENFVPGDWVYILNTDKPSYAFTGYEGSNAIYLGDGRFDDYYNDNHHHYLYKEKLDEVWQWRHGVFSRERDQDKIEPLTDNDYLRLGRKPVDGGLVLDWRAFPLPLYELSPSP